LYSGQIARSARDAVLVACPAIALAGFAAGAVRVLPWLLDPEVPWRVAAPFARGLAAIAIEAALLIGWPVGWAIACLHFVESGEARVHQTLGEAPIRTVGRLAVQGSVLAAALTCVALLCARDAGAPGRVATELLAESRASCLLARAPTTYAVPFTDLTWLCSPGGEPLLVGSPTPTLHSAIISAKGARVAGDFRALELDDARGLLAGSPPIAFHVASLSMHGMAPWARASTVAPALRALILVSTALAAGILGAYAVLRHAVKTRLGVLVIGAGSPLGALGLMRLLERAGARPIAFLLVPLACSACTLATSAVLVGRRRLRGGDRAAST